MKGLITIKRDEFHRQLIMNGTWSFSKMNKFNTDRVASNADTGQKTSVILSNNLLDKIMKHHYYNKHSLSRKQFTGREIMRASVFNYIECDYNRWRRHSACGGLSPEQF